MVTGVIRQMKAIHAAFLIVLTTRSLAAQLPVPAPFAGWSATDRGEGAAALLTPISILSFVEAPDGRILYTETGRIREIDTHGNVHTILSEPGISLIALSLDAAGNIYYESSTPIFHVRRLSAGGSTAFAGGGTVPPADGVAATTASLSIGRIAVDPSGAVYISDVSNAAVFRVDAQGVLRKVAGTGTRGTMGEGGPAISAQLNTPLDLGFDSAGTLYLEDFTGTDTRILKIDASGILTRVPNTPPYTGSSEMSVAADGSLYFTTNGTLIKRSPEGTLSTVTTSSGIGFEGCGAGPFAPVPVAGGIHNVVADGRGLLFVNFNLGSNRARLVRLDASGSVTAIAGGPNAFSGDGGPATAASFAFPQALAVDLAGNLYIGDTGNHRVRKVTKDGLVHTIAGSGPVADTLYCKPSPNDIDWISGLAVDSSGVLYIADVRANRVWKMSPGGALTMFAGNGQSTMTAAIAGSTASAVAIDSPSSVAVDARANVWVASYSNGLVKISSAGVILEVHPEVQAKAIASMPSSDIYVATAELAFHLRPDGQLIPLAAAAGSVTPLTGPGGPAAAHTYVEDVPGPGRAAFAGADGTLYFLAIDTKVVRPDCALRTVKGNFYVGAADPGGGVYLTDGTSGQIWRMDPEPQASGGASPPALAAAAVRSLATDLVDERLVNFIPGSAGGVGLSSLEFVSTAIAPGELIHIYGTCLGTFDRLDASYDSSGKLPFSMGGTQVAFDDVPATLLSVVSGEIWAVVPYGLSGKSQTLMKVSTAAGSATASIPVAPVAPGVFGVKDSSGKRRLVALNEDGSRNSPQNPAEAGSEVALYATGLGQTSPPSLDGFGRTADRSVAADIEAYVNNARAAIVYAGPAPGFVGLEQINILVPATQSGTVLLKVGGVFSAEVATLYVAQ
jgi:uncharacterized protein (TIGR03437 family)